MADEADAAISLDGPRRERSLLPLWRWKPERAWKRAVKAKSFMLVEMVAAPGNNAAGDRKN